MIFTIRHVVAAVALLGFSTCNAFFVATPCTTASRPGLMRSAIARNYQPQQLPTVARSSGEAKVAMNAGFGQGKAKKLKETPPSFTSGEALARAALKEYKRLRRDGGTVAQVHARVKGSEEWYPVGNVCTEAGNTAEGVQGQKRLFLEHATDMHRELRSGAGQKVTLEAGYSMDTGGDVVVCKAKYAGEKAGAALDPLPIGPYFRFMDDGKLKPETTIIP